MSKVAPNPYMAILSGGVLQDNTESAMEILRLPLGSRTFALKCVHQDGCGNGSVGKRCKMSRMGIASHSKFEQSTDVEAISLY